ncbi:CydX/CbdX family cytochrome bd oxidase small subunit [Aeromonas simiae]|uniref:Cytochrome bd oxidase small subunit, CydX/CbdX family n=1 Tax=Aeromonas simiae TaxID=218936 RepID=A0A5J6WYK3_9GAMM|nr:CydX/CbdX family cytochrome bd oxidase small subunit [Aeromonas simiae]QFI54938.1 cytochrome bd oxidase small subunit, CydX/CbdX family [Aeromonas simiae]
MWYFTWFLGLGFALLVGLCNLLWLEARWAAGLGDDETHHE